MSVPWTISQPPAMAWPLIAAITGFDGVQSRSMARRPSVGSATTASSNSSAGFRAPVVSGIELAEVGAGTEGLVARAGDDGDAEPVVVVDLLPRLGQADDHLRVQGVAGLGPVERDDRHVPVALEIDDGHEGCS